MQCNAILCYARLDKALLCFVGLCSPAQHVSAVTGQHGSPGERTVAVCRGLQRPRQRAVLGAAGTKPKLCCISTFFPAESHRVRGQLNTPTRGPCNALGGRTVMEETRRGKQQRV